MRKHNLSKNLSLSTSTIRTLDPKSLDQLAGASVIPSKGNTCWPHDCLR